MNLLFIGDVVGESGSEYLESQMYALKKEYDIDFTVVNGENSAVGNGISRQSYNRLIHMGADVVTTGNHAFKRIESGELFEEYGHTLLRPANFHKDVQGQGYTVIDLGYVKIAVVNLMGTVNLPPLENPFFKIDEILEEIDTPNIFVDFHAEATSEKKAMGLYLKGRVTALLGTHTHVQTADEIILAEHTAYITDVGMTGPGESALGVDGDIIINLLKYNLPVKFCESKNPPIINGVVVSFDEKSGKATNIVRVFRRK